MFNKNSFLNIIFQYSNLREFCNLCLREPFSKSTTQYNSIMNENFSLYGTVIILGTPPSVYNASSLESALVWTGGACLSLPKGCEQLGKSGRFPGGEQ